MRSTSEVLSHHLKCFADRDLDGPVADYAPDALFFTAKTGLVHYIEAATRRRRLRIPRLDRGDAGQFLTSSEATSLLSVTRAFCFRHSPPRFGRRSAPPASGLSEPR